MMQRRTLTRSALLKIRKLQSTAIVFLLTVLLIYTGQGGVQGYGLSSIGAAAPAIAQGPNPVQNERISCSIDPFSTHSFSPPSRDDHVALQEAVQLEQRVIELRDEGHFTEALPLAQQALTIREQALGSLHPLVGNSLSQLAILHQYLLQYKEAESFYCRALIIFEQVLNNSNPGIITAISNLAGIYHIQSKYVEAEPLYRRILSIQEQIPNTNPLDIVNTLSYLAGIYYVQGKYVEAEPLYHHILTIQEQIPDINPLVIVNTLSYLAGTYYVQGKYVEAESLYRRASTIQEQTPNTNPLDIATTAINLLVVYQAQNNDVEAELALQRALAADRETQNLEVVDRLHRLGFFYLEQGNYQDAEWLFRHILTDQAQALGDNHLGIAFSLSRLAAFYINQGQYAEAEPLLHRALTVSEQAPESENLQGFGLIAIREILRNLLTLYIFQGDYAQAATYLQSIAMLDAQLYGQPLDRSGAEFPNFFTSALDWTEANVNEALTSLAWINDFTEEFATSIVGSELRQQTLMQMQWRLAGIPITFYLQATPNNPNAARLALTTILQRKGRVLDSLTDSLQLLRQKATPTHQALLDHLIQIRAYQANLSYNRPPDLLPQQYRLQFEQLENLANQLEADLSRRSVELRSELQPITVAAIQPQIPADAALVELVRYQSFNPKATRSEERWGTWHYVAYVLHQTGDPQAIDLGEAAAIDAQVESFLQVLRSPSQSVQQAARQLDTSLMQPIRTKLNGATHLLISPDSQLNLIPFAALVDERDRYLIESYTITYLTSGRDLLRLQNNVASHQPPVVFANPNYDTANGSETVQINARALPRALTQRGEQVNRRSVDLVNLSFRPLDGTQLEAEAIAPLLPNVTVLTQAQATENALKQLQAPSILHIATHGFFLQDIECTPITNTRGNDFPVPATVEVQYIGEREESCRPTANNNENPLLRSGLALAGFNSRQSGDEDGVLTALEAAGLDLYGTQLVVLSACETGLGNVVNGEGVYGLRRAFELAGAESELMSLWKVDDMGTSQLMSLYYQHLMAGEGRSAALRDVQLELLNTGAYNHPYYWASFIFSGEWQPLEN